MVDFKPYNNKGELMKILSFIVWIPILVYMILIAFAVTLIVITAIGAVVVSMAATAVCLYVAELYRRHFTPGIWLWKIERWWWFKRKTF